MLLLWLVQTSGARLLAFWWSCGRVLPWQGVAFLDRITPYVETRVDLHSPHAFTGSLWRIRSFSLRSIVSLALVGPSVGPSHRGAEQRLSHVGMAAGADRGCGVRSAQLRCKA